jgi:predicted Ser/Thr protein kinase
MPNCNDFSEWHGAEVAIKVSNQPTNTEEFLSEAKLTL